ncbi:MAG: chitobiase/beta-hexosaminidase C-terminal domain-containing protein [Prevotella sp.]|nr:chitobiase/beta-hexosaminidase C-terminal domain-containing protein [Prevotella sp.]
MKKLFTLVCALMGFAGAVNAATVDDIAVCKHSYVLCFDDWDGNGTAKPGKGQLFGDGYFLEVTDGSVATNKGKVNLSVLTVAKDEEGNEYIPDDNHVTQYFVDYYGEDYPNDQLNSWRLKNAQDVIAMRVTAGSKLIFFLQGNNKSGKDARIPKIATDAKLENALNAAPGEDHPATDAGFRYEWTAPDDGLIYIGSYNGDMFLSYLIVEANEAAGTPSVKMSAQTYENGLWYRDVTCVAKKAEINGKATNTVVTYTVDGSDPTAASPVYKDPIRCYGSQTVKFQAFSDLRNTGVANDAFKLTGADNEANVSFKFNAPEIGQDGANIIITSEYENATNYYQLNDGEEVEGSSATLSESAIVSAYTKIQNGSYATFTSALTTADVRVLTPMAEGTVTIKAVGTKVLDQEAMDAAKAAAEESGEEYEYEEIFKVSDDAYVEHDNTQFFVRTPQFKLVEQKAYQVPEGQEVYLQMNDPMKIYFQIAEGFKADVTVTCTKNACKDINANTAGDIDATEKPDDYTKALTTDANNRTPHVNLDGTTYDGKDLNPTEGEAEADANIIVIPDVAAGEHVFSKYSGTGNILVSSIEIKVKADDAAVSTIKADNIDANAPAYNLAGQKVNDSFKGLVIKGGKKFVK